VPVYDADATPVTAPSVACYAATGGEEAFPAFRNPEAELGDLMYARGDMWMAEDRSLGKAAGGRHGLAVAPPGDQNPTRFGSSGRAGFRRSW
jgi:hypothetical protein